MMISPAIVVLIGILLILIPHFALPLGYLKISQGGAHLLSECSIWYHPSFYIGLLFVIVGVLSFRFRKILWAALVIAVAGLFQSFIMKPVSFYFQSEDPLVILAQTYSIRAHLHIRPVIALLSIFAILTVIMTFLVKRERTKPVLITISRISLANLKRRTLRTTALVVSLAIAIGIFFSYVLLSKSIENTLEIGAGRLGADIMVVPSGAKKPAKTVLLSGGPSLFYLKGEILDKLKGYQEIERLSPQLYLQPFTQLICCIAERFLIIAYDPETDFTVGPWIRYKLQGQQGMYDVVVGHSVKYYPGQDLTLYGRKMKVVASLDPTGLGYFDKSVFIPLEGARRMLRSLKKYSETRKIPHRRVIKDKSFSHLTRPEAKGVSLKDIDPEGVSAIFLKLRPDVPVKEFSKRLEKEIDGIGTIVVKESTVTVKRQISSLLNSFLVPVIVLLLMCTLILGVVFSMSVKERQREIGLLRAMGSCKKTVFNLIITESLIVSALGALCGTLFGSTIFFVFKNNIMAALNLLYVWPSITVIFSVISITVLTSLLIGIISGLYPALRAATMEPYLAIRSGER